VFLLQRAELEGPPEQIAVDYLLKPITREQLQRKLEDLRSRLQRMLPREDFGPPHYLQQLRVLQGDRIHMLPTGAILALTAEEGCTLIHTAEGVMRSNWSLRELAAELDPLEFQPLHRNVLVRLGAVERIVRGEGEQLLVKLKGCERLFPVSRVHSGLLREL
jgi:DNA-binding LytR/AlgR family response regulator